MPRATTPARALYGDALALLETVGDRPEIARVHCEMGWTALAAARVPAARRAFQRAVSAYDEVGSVRGTGLALMGLAAVDPGVVSRIEALKATIPRATLDDLVASGKTLSPAAVLAMVRE